MKLNWNIKSALKEGTWMTSLIGTLGRKFFNFNNFVQQIGLMDDVKACTGA